MGAGTQERRRPQGAGSALAPMSSFRRRDHPASAEHRHVSPAGYSPDPKDPLHDVGQATFPSTPAPSTRLTAAAACVRNRDHGEPAYDGRAPILSLANRSVRYRDEARRNSSRSTSRAGSATPSAIVSVSKPTRHRIQLLRDIPAHRRGRRTERCRRPFRRRA